MRRAEAVAAAAMIAASAAFAAGCAAGTAPPLPATGPPGLDRFTAQAVADELTRASGTRGEEITRRLGAPTAVRFDSGYEVWVYRIAEAGAGSQRAGGANRAETRDGAGELVILVAPSGEVVKARTRFAPTSDPRPGRGPPAGQ